MKDKVNIRKQLLFKMRDLTHEGKLLTEEAFRKEYDFEESMKIREKQDKIYKEYLFMTNLYEALGRTKKDANKNIQEDNKRSRSR